MGKGGTTRLYFPTNDLSYEAPPQALVAEVSFFLNFLQKVVTPAPAAFTPAPDIGGAFRRHHCIGPVKVRLSPQILPDHCS